MTVLANEQVIDGKGWRSGAPIERKKPGRSGSVKHHRFQPKICWPRLDEHGPTGRDKVRTDAGQLDRQESRRAALHRFPRCSQTGRPTPGPGCVFSRRGPDTIFGASFCRGVAADHPMAGPRSPCRRRPEIGKFIDECQTSRGTSEEADIESGRKAAASTPACTCTPSVPQEEWEHCPLYIANFVLMDYGTGAIFGCPGARPARPGFRAQIRICPSRPCVIPEGESRRSEASPRFEIGDEAFIGRRHASINSRLSSTACRCRRGQIGRSIGHAEEDLAGAKARRELPAARLGYLAVSAIGVAPIPIIHCDRLRYRSPVPKDALPVDAARGRRPSTIARQPARPASDLEARSIARAAASRCAARNRYARHVRGFESWYFARFTSARRRNADRQGRRPRITGCRSDQYIGGIEHAILHLLYSRFFHPRDETKTGHARGIERALRRAVHPGHGHP